MRTFSTGATRDSDDEKIDLEGFLSPLVLRRFGEYMTVHRVQADGKLRASDNWQKGIPQSAYLKSLLRHVLTVWLAHRGETPPEPVEDALCAILFNAQGYLFERLTDPDRAPTTENARLRADIDHLTDALREQHAGRE